MLAQPKRVALLVYLAVEGRRGSVSRDRVLGLFWPDSDESRARNTLSQALHYLRNALGTEVIESKGASTIGIRSEQLWCDATAFADALERGEVELALDLYRGDFCPTLFTSGMPEVEQWLDLQRRRLRVQAQTAARALAEGLLARGDQAGAIRAGRRALALEPDDESDVRALLTLLDQAGDRTGALHAYQEYTRRMATVLEAEPEPETKRLMAAIRSRPSLVTAVPGSDPAVGLPAPEALSTPPSAPSARRRALIPRLVTFAALALAITILAGAVALGSRPHPTDAPVRTVAVLPFALHGSGASSYLRDGMVDLLSAKLGDASGLQIIDPRSAIAASEKAGDTGAPRDIARQLGAGWYIKGEVIEVAGRLQLNGSLYQVGDDTRPVTTSSAVGDTAALFELVDDLTGRMLAGLIPGRDTSLTRLAALTTHSLPALKSFLQGERAMRQGRDAEAAEAFRVAATIDTSFALAQYRLAVVANWVYVPDAPNPLEWAARAARHAERLSPLGRDLLTAFQAYKEIKADEVARKYRDLVAAHPDNVEAWFMLGETRFHYNPVRGHSPRSSRQAFEKVLSLDPNNLHALIHLARLAAWDGRVADVDSLAARYLSITTDAARGLEMRALRAYVHNDLRERARIVDLARDADNRVVMSVLQAAMQFAQNLDAARELGPVFLESVADSLGKALGHRNLSELHLAANQWDRGRAAWMGSSLDQGWLLETESLLAGDPVFGVSPARVAALRDSLTAHDRYAPLAGGFPHVPAINLAERIYRIGLLDARLGDTASARHAALQLLAAQDSSRVIAPQLGHALQAELLRGEGRLAEALGELQKLDLEQSGSFVISIAHYGVRERFLEAELLRELGRDAEALDVYESFIGPYDLPYLALAHRGQAAIYRKLGNREREEFHLGRYRALWGGEAVSFRARSARNP